jgi:hypothetical protein
MLDRRKMIPRLIQHRPNPSMLEGNSRTLRIMLIVDIRQLASRRDLLPLRRQRRDLRKRSLAFRGEDVSDHKRW